jgi:hypothetical protein
LELRPRLFSLALAPPRLSEPLFADLPLPELELPAELPLLDEPPAELPLLELLPELPLLELLPELPLLELPPELWPPELPLLEPPPELPPLPPPLPPPPLPPLPLPPPPRAMTGVATKPTATTVATATAIFLRLNMKDSPDKKV